MPPSVLIVASTRAYADSQEILRIQDTAAALQEAGNAVDVLIPRMSPLLTSVLNPSVRVFTVPRLVPFMGNPPRRPSVRRFLVGALMLFRGVALLSRRSYTALHGVNDGALVARSISGCATMGRMPFIAEIHRPFARPGFPKGPRAAFARLCERRALRRTSRRSISSDGRFRAHACRSSPTRTSNSCRPPSRSLSSPPPSSTSTHTPCSKR